MKDTPTEPPPAPAETRSRRRSTRSHLSPALLQPASVPNHTLFAMSQGIAGAVAAVVVRSGSVLSTSCHRKPGFPRIH